MTRREDRSHSQLDSSQDHGALQGTVSVEQKEKTHSELTDIDKALWSRYERGRGSKEVRG